MEITDSLYTNTTVSSNVKINNFICNNIQFTSNNFYNIVPDLLDGTSAINKTNIDSINLNYKYLNISTTTYTIYTSNINYNWNDINYNNNLYIISSPQILFKTTNLINIQSTYTLSLPNTFHKVINNNIDFFAIYYNGPNTYILKSYTLSNGIYWYTTSYINSILTDIYYDKQFIGITNTNIIFKSNDTITWTSIDINISSNWNFITSYNNNYLIISDNLCIKSIDLISWTTCFNILSNWSNITSSNNICLIISPTIYIHSKDLITWTTVNVINDSITCNFNSDKLIFNIVTLNNIYLYTSDCINWVTSNIPINSNWNTIINNIFISNDTLVSLYDIPNYLFYSYDQLYNSYIERSSIIENIIDIYPNTTQLFTINIPNYKFITNIQNVGNINIKILVDNKLYTILPSNCIYINVIYNNNSIYFLIEETLNYLDIQTNTTRDFIRFPNGIYSLSYSMFYRPYFIIDNLNSVTYTKENILNGIIERINTPNIDYLPLKDTLIYENIKDNDTYKFTILNKGSGILTIKLNNNSMIYNTSSDIFIQLNSFESSTCILVYNKISDSFIVSDIDRGYLK